MDRRELYKKLLDVSGTYVEIGTCWGGFADFLMKNTPVTQLICVDPYKHYPGDIYIDSLNMMTQQECDKKFSMVCNRLLGDFPNKVVMFREESVKASLQIQDNSLSFCYIDGNHCYNSVREDILAWLPKIKNGGILAGDDVEPEDSEYVNNNSLIVHQPGAFGLYGVREALKSVKKEFPWFDYTIEGNQFYWKKV